MPLPPQTLHYPGLALALALILLAAPICGAQMEPSVTPTSDEEVRLPAFSVSAEKANPYASGDALSAARISAPLSETPASISVISLQFMTDIGAESVLDATRYSSGMSAGRAAGVSGIADRHVIRGFESVDGRVVDNFQTGFQANFDPAFIERVEVVKGPNSILSPTGAPGGTINVISKSPLFKAANSLSLSVGEFDAQKISIDSTGPLPWGHDKIAYRVIFDAQDTETYLPGRVKLYNLEAALTWKISRTSQLSVKYFGFDWTQEGAAGAANTWGIGVDPNLPFGAELYNEAPANLGFTSRGKNGVTDWSTRKNRANMLVAEYTASLTDKISMRFAANFLNNKFGQDQGLPSVPNISNNRYDPATGIPTPNQTWAKNAAGVYVPTFSLLWDPTKIARTATYIQSLTQTAQLQQDFAGNFKAGPVSLQGIAGWSLVHSITFPNFTRSAPLPTVNLFAPDDNPPRPANSAYTTSVRTSSGNRQVQAYAYSRAGFFKDRVFLTAGAARIWLNNMTTNLLIANGGAPLVASHDTYMGGLLIKPIEPLTVYYSFSTNAAGVTFNSQPLFRTGKQHEWEFKTDLIKQRLTFTAAHYQIIQNNLSTANPAFNVDPINNPQNILSDQNNRGFEFELKGGLTKDLSIVASYTTQKLRDSFDRRPRNIADRTAGFLLNYRFSDGTFKNLGMFVGMTRQGKSAGETPASSATPLGVIEQVGFYVPGFTQVNIGASYSWHAYSFSLTTDNLFDHQGFWQAAGRGAVPPIPGRNIRFTTTVKF